MSSIELLRARLAPSAPPMPTEPGDEPDAPTLPTLDDADEAVGDVDAAVARQRKVAKARRIHRARTQASNVKTAVRSTLGRSGSREDDAVDEAFFTREVEPKGIQCVCAT